MCLRTLIQHAHTHMFIRSTPRNFIIPMRAGKRLARKSNETWQNKEKQHRDQNAKEEEDKKKCFILCCKLSSQLGMSLVVYVPFFDGAHVVMIRFV